MLNQEFISTGFCFINSNHYVSQDNASSLHDIKKVYDEALEQDGGEFRYRAYLKLQWNKLTDQIHIPDNQAYYQTSASNKADGGKIRQFKIMDSKVLSIPIINSILSKNLQMIKRYPALQKENALTLGLHFIRYQAAQYAASYSSPAWLHKDDEPLVFIHLINLSKSALGGDNLIAEDKTKNVTHVIRLENEIDTLVLNKNVYHAVTPLGSKSGIATRDVILFTVEPHYTQQCELGSECA